MTTPAPGPSPAEQARTLAAARSVATLATRTESGDPWASLITYGLLDGAPVICVSTLAEHGRNLALDPRASVLISATGPHRDPLANGRVTLAGRMIEPQGTDATAARRAHADAVPASVHYLDLGDFTLWRLHVERVRWVGGYARMGSATGADYAAAEPDPVSPYAAAAIAHLNDGHREALTSMARTLGGHPDADAAECTGADRYGLDLAADTAAGRARIRVDFGRRLDGIDELRSATVDLARRAGADRAGEGDSIPSADG